MGSIIARTTPFLAQSITKEAASSFAKDGVRTYKVLHGTSDLYMSSLKKGDEIIVDKVRGIWAMVKPDPSVPLKDKAQQELKGQCLTRAYAVGSIASNTETSSDNKVGNPTIITFEVLEYGEENENHTTEETLKECALAKVSPVVHLPGGTKLKVHSIHHMSMAESMVSGVVFSPFATFVAAPVAACKTAWSIAQKALTIFIPAVEAFVVGGSEELAATILQSLTVI